MKKGIKRCLMIDLYQTWKDVEIDIDDKDKLLTTLLTFKNEATRYVNYIKSCSGYEFVKGDAWYKALEDYVHTANTVNMKVHMLTLTTKLVLAVYRLHGVSHPPMELDDTPSIPWRYGARGLGGIRTGGFDDEAVGVGMSLTLPKLAEKNAYHTLDYRIDPQYKKENDVYNATGTYVSSLEISDSSAKVWKEMITADWATWLSDPNEL